MPASLHARAIRTAISPRLAMRTLRSGRLPVAVMHSPSEISSNSELFFRNVSTRMPRLPSRREGPENFCSSPGSAPTTTCREPTVSACDGSPLPEHSYEHRTNLPSLVPQGGPGDPEAGEHGAQYGQTQPHDGVVIPADSRDERTAEAADGERARNLQWFSGRDVGIDLHVADVGAGDFGARARACASPVGGDREVPGMQGPGPPAHPAPTFAGDVSGLRFAQALTVKFQQRVAAQREVGAARMLGGDGPGLRLGEDLHGFRDAERAVLARLGERCRLIDVGDNDDGVDARRAERGGAGGGDRKSTRLNSSHVAISYAVF